MRLRRRVEPQAMGWSQADLAKAMQARGFDWRQATVSRTEQADRPIRLNEATALATLFRIDLAVMLRPYARFDAKEYERVQARLTAAQVAVADANRELEEAEADADADADAVEQDLRSVVEEMDTLVKPNESEAT